MKNKITKVITAIFVFAILIQAFAFSSFGIAVDPKIQILHTDGSKTSYSSLSSAINAAVDGDTVMIAGEIQSYTVSGGVTVTKNISFKTGSDFYGNKKHLSYTGTTAPLFTVADGGALTVIDSEIYGNDGFTIPSGGFALVKNGGKLILGGKTDEPVTIKDFGLKAQDSAGGAIYVEQGGQVVVNTASFTNNSAANGSDIYAELKNDVTLAEGVTVSTVYGENVDISGLHLILSGEIGLVFHAEIPEKYLEGSFELTSDTSDTVTYKISDCGMDEQGRYLAKYNMSAIELSEEVTLTIYDGDGNFVASKTKTVEEYGKTLLDGNDATAKEKNVVKALLNYGHFAQIECANYGNWEIGTDFEETAKYAELSTDISVFDDYEIEKTGSDSGIPNFGVQLNLGYKTDINLYFPTNTKPEITVNGEEADVYETTVGKYTYGISIKDISALDLEKEFTVVINDQLTLKLSAMSYCKLATKQCGEATVNAVKALYEFYKATAEYNSKPVSPGEDTSWGEVIWDR